MKARGVQVAPVEPRMKAICYEGRKAVRLATKPDPEIVDDRDAIVRVTLSAIGGADLSAYQGTLQGFEPGRVLGREMIGIVEDVGEAVTELSVGDRVALPASISCGRCAMCTRSQFAQCLRSNPVGGSCAVFGFTEETGGFDGGQAEAVRVPFADVTACKLPADLSDEQALLVGDALAAAWQATTLAGVGPGACVAVWGCGVIGLLSAMCALELGASRVFAIDDVAHRLELASRIGAEPIDFDAERGDEAVLARTQGRGADVCIEAVGFEAKRGLLERVETAVGLGTTPGRTLRECALACAPAGVISVAGFFTTSVLAFPMGQVFGKGLRILSGPVSARPMMPELFARIAGRKLDPTRVITHRVKLDAAPAMYEMLAERGDGCIKVTLAP